MPKGIAGPGVVDKRLGPRKNRIAIAKTTILRKQKEHKEAGLPPYDRWANQLKNLGKYAGVKKKKKRGPYKSHKPPMYQTDIKRLSEQVDYGKVMRLKLYADGVMTPVSEKHVALCSICNIKEEEAKKYIESRYLTFHACKEIAIDVKRIYGVEVDGQAIRNHCLTFGLDCERATNSWAILTTIVVEGMKENSKSGNAPIQTKDVLTALKLRMEKDGELAKQNINVGVNINTPATKAEREEKLVKGMEQFGGRAVVREAVSEVIDEVESE
jgi:hypothetical protein